MVDYNGLENRRTERYRGFESLSLRKVFIKKKEEQRTDLEGLSSVLLFMLDFFVFIYTSLSCMAHFICLPSEKALPSVEPRLM